MPLVISMQLGEDFFVAHERFVVAEIKSTKHVVVERAKDGAYFDVTDLQMVEPVPNVFMSVAERGQMKLARLAIDAPREIMILRGDKYRTGKPPSA
jgi:hypothetical protein